MSVAIIFRGKYSHNQSHSVSIIDVADDWDVECGDIQAAFEKWKEEEYPEEFRFKLKEKKYIRIYADTRERWGWVNLVRPWGNNWRHLPGFHTFRFTMELVI